MNNKNNSDKPGSLSAWLDYIEGLNPTKMELGLSRVQKVISRLSLTSLEKALKIEIAGTNGKGSTAALISSAVSFSGISTGLYTSPHLLKFNERIMIDGQPVSDELLCEAFSLVYDNAKDIPLTYFEFTTLAGFVCFDRAGVKVAVLEIGLGGRLDAVNALDADICVITSIGLDHTHILGDTLEKIAAEKAGIIKENSQVVVGRMKNEPLYRISQICKEKNASLMVEGVDFYGLSDSKFRYVQKGSSIVSAFEYPMPKIPQICAPAALKVIHLLLEKGLKISTNAIAKAMSEVSLPGRMQCVHRSPAIYLDVAHNPPAAVHLKEVLGRKIKFGRRYAVIGMLKDKDIESVLEILKTSFDAFYVASLPTERGEKSQRLYNALIAGGTDNDLVKSYSDVEQALKECLADTDSNDEIYVIGSFVTVTEAVNALKKIDLDK
ncbi:dihydrofolate synthase / folylpolyglutamate synthase [Succinivibrio dextrinosolvens]|uniref:bifunctional folylpolyglutamate synthase/dihydrofolate synthase n=1 Tax=Succinivibrio dextrinosolvens TaxID=83771 RepID=UPI0008DF8876|nr:folylpolyglutamate synthase/dihydrofolate synthase family protein [Succinivibrio dextrinosolvens]SFS86558.1 dihydrofolate synthase / folylpolyglutamate synthase [Succinivibrio dextrinosolvens]